jgi:hypothetical protein
MCKMNEYITFSIAPYCLAKLLLALHSSKINNFAITQEDNNLVVSVSVEELERIVYPINRNPQDCGCKGSE